MLMAFLATVEERRRALEAALRHLAGLPGRTRRLLLRPRRGVSANRPPQCEHMRVGKGVVMPLARWRGPHSFERAHGDAEQAPDLDRWNLTTRSSRVGCILADAEISSGRLWHAECQFFAVGHSEVLCLLHGISRALVFSLRPFFPLVKLMRGVYRAKMLGERSYGEEKTVKARPPSKT